MLSVSLRHIEYAIAVAEYGSVSMAAAAVHVSQPALSVAIAGLEEHIGNPLFIRRKGSPLVLTSFGRDFVDRASLLVTQFEELVEMDVNMAEGRRPLVIGCYEDLGPLLIGPILAESKEHYADANVRIRTGDFDFLSEEMLAGRIDFSVTYDLGIDSSFDTREVASIYPHILLYADHPLTKRKNISLADIATEPLVLVDQEHSLWHMIGLFRGRHLSPRIINRAPTFEIMRSMVANGLGIGLSYTRSLSNLSYDGKPLENRKIVDDLLPEPIVIVTNRKNPLSPFAEKLTDWIAERSTYATAR
jgi:DNA-binding transcriptional LysR family regulator